MARAAAAVRLVAETVLIAGRSLAAHARVVVIAVALACVIPGCMSPVRPVRRVEDPLRISDTLHMGDARRQASTRLVIEGLDIDGGRGSSRALTRYERAIQVDPTNPFAYLAIARHHIASDDPARALGYLDQAEILLSSEALRSPRVDVHLMGLRGAALDTAGRRDGAEMLGRASELSPGVWGDGYLDASELR